MAAVAGVQDQPRGHTLIAQHFGPVECTTVALPAAPAALGGRMFVAAVCMYL